MLVYLAIVKGEVDGGRHELDWNAGEVGGNKPGSPLGQEPDNSTFKVSLDKKVNLSVPGTKWEKEGKEGRM